MLFPETPAEVLRSPASRGADAPGSSVLERAEPAPVVGTAPMSPVAQEVLEVSSAMFAERGYYAVGMEEIAAAADVSRATLYRYFSTKDKILAELTHRAVNAIEVQAPHCRRSPVADRMDAGYVRFHRAYRGVIRAWFDGTVAEQLSDADVDHGIGAIHHAAAALLSTVDLPPGIDADVASAVFMAVLGRMSEPTAGPTSDSAERAAELMVTLLRRSLLRELPAG